MRRWRDAVWILAFTIILTGILNCLPCNVTHAATVSEAEQEKREAEERQRTAGESMKDLEQKREEAFKGAGELSRELSALLIDMELLESDINVLKKQIQESDQAFRESEAGQTRQYAAMKKRIQYLYENGKITYLDILLKAKNIGDVINGSEYFEQIYEYDKNMILDYEKIKEINLQQKESLEEQRSELETMENEYALRKTGLETVIDEKRKDVQDFDKELEAVKKEAQAQALIVQQKTEEIRILRAEQAARQQAFRQGRTTLSLPVKSIGGTQFGREVADYALQYIGNPYVWGGTSLTRGADCSGFTQSVYRHFGIEIPRTSAEQAAFGREVAYEDMEPGDLICYPGHVAMYTGGGRIVHARSAKEGICVDEDPAYRTIVSIRRPW